VTASVLVLAVAMPVTIAAGIRSNWSP